MILFMVAALVVGIFAMPANHGPVETEFAAGKLQFDPTLADLTPRLEIECKPDFTIKITRIGFPDILHSDASVALAITRKGFDLTIEERITPGTNPLLQSEITPVNTAVFYLEGLAPDRYHIKYNSEATSSFAAFSINNRPGLTTSRPLLQA